MSSSDWQDSQDSDRTRQHKRQQGVDSILQQGHDRRVNACCENIRISECYKNEKHFVVNASILDGLRVDQS